MFYLVPQFHMLLGFILLNSGFINIGEQVEKTNYRFMFYNVENLFDIYDDSLTEDNDFLPGGLMRWNKTRYEKKINAISKTILAAGEWQAPAVVSFCEVENRGVIEDLVFGTALLKYNYSIIHFDSPDERGIDLALIYRKDLVRVIACANLIPSTVSGYEFTSRGVLYTKILIGSDSIHLFINHWPSRRGGVLASEDLRTEIARMVKWKTDSIFMAENCNSKIILMGDFNCNPVDPVIKMLTGQNKGDSRLVNLSAKMESGIKGTYRYQGSWEIIDQIIVSEFMLETDKGLFLESNSAKCFNAGFLLMKDPVYPGSAPYATYRGYRYQGGFSDHLPVYIDLRAR